MPAVSRAITYGTRKAPPPFSYATPGNRQMLPSPTAEPIADRMKPTCPVNCSRGGEVSVVVVLTGVEPPR